MAGRGTAHLGDPAEALLRIEDLNVRFKTGRGTVFAVTDVSLDIRRGETLGLVGESGCGKSTTGRAIMQLPPPTEGRVLYDGDDLTTLSPEDLRRTRTKLQMIFQDPISSLNPRRKVEDIVAEGLKIWQPAGRTPLATAAMVALALGVLCLVLPTIGTALAALVSVPVAVVGFVSAIVAWIRSEGRPGPLGISLRQGLAMWVLGSAVYFAAAAVAFGDGGESTGRLFGVFALVVGVGLALMHFAGFGQPVDPGMAKRVDEILDAVGLDPAVARGRRPHQFSGGQCQRISIARAVVTEPDLIICDEPVSALDVSVQAQILNLLEDLKARYGLTLVFIAHDLAVVKNVSDRVAVMYLGRMCEVGPPDVIYAQPAHPYTQLLLDAIPEPDPDLRDKESAPLTGELPSPLAPPSGCHFRTRCPQADTVCAEVVPEMAPTGDGRFVACHHPLVETGVDITSSASRG